MLFNSYGFIFGFFPIVFGCFFYIGKYSHKLAVAWLAIASLFFYGWWSLYCIWILVASVICNYGMACFIRDCVSRQSSGEAKKLLMLAIVANLVLLGYFKYVHFFAENFEYLTGISLSIGKIILPLGISFFTFTQLAFLVDTYQGKVKEYDFTHYFLFVTYFPHLIAGPVLHHKEMMPQFAKQNVCRLNGDNVAAGLTLFELGLAKKILLADSLAGYSTPIFNAVGAGGKPMFVEAWVGALAYSLQLYFDFSAYSDMAIGLSLMFNVCLPINFYSPYKASSIIDFWRRWHMTLARFLRDYVYIPLGGNRKGAAHRYVNVMVTMLLGGLWHGANWTFVIWGGLQGLYLIANHLWRWLKLQNNWAKGGRLAQSGSCLLTFLAVVVGWVFFRANNVSSAIAMLQGMAGLHGVSVHPLQTENLKVFFQQIHVVIHVDGFAPLSSVRAHWAVLQICFGLSLVFFLPNTSQIIKYSHLLAENTQSSMPVSFTVDERKKTLLLRLIEWQPVKVQAAFYGALFFILLKFMAVERTSEFLYFQF